MITFYDLAAKDPIKCWSFNPWKVRYVLNLKKIPYRTIYVDFGTSTNSDGTPVHTVPSIIDDKTGEAVTDSYKIVEYLDKRYPDTPKAFPPGTEALQAAFYKYFNEQTWDLAILIIHSVPNILSKESSLEYYHRSRAAWFGKPVEQIRPVGEELEKLWEKAHAFFDALEGWYAKSSGSFLVGDTPSFGDFVVVALFRSMRIVRGEDSEDWRKLSTMNNGRWVKLLNDLEKYASVEN
ncbi:hypothetical protein D9756_005163 [Leucocoprinus leucothites]|uniref:GST N-terminal domain-containing protein n=1 Tax=Leucocoprinus leucothites TaxID=201217 RepID=A0A8H5G9S5_9AGAR|nr:hypothetical protein D9756_005163 [Leucoagaricus leucothites]